jgi:hypothetical protein
MAQSSGTQGLWLDMKDIYKPLLNLSPVELRALAYGITPFYKLNDSILYGFDEKGQTFAVYSLPEPNDNVRKARFAPKCVNLCGHDLRRPHLTCNVCRYRKIQKGKLPPLVPVRVYVLSMGMNRQFERLQGWLVKKLLALVEFVALWREGKGKKEWSRTV